MFSWFCGCGSGTDPQAHDEQDAEIASNFPSSGFLFSNFAPQESPFSPDGTQPAVVKTISGQFQDSLNNAMHYVSGGGRSSGSRSSERNISNDFGSNTRNISGHQGDVSEATAFAAVVSKLHYAKRFQKAVANQGAPNVLEVDRGVHIERRYDLYVPRKGLLRTIKVAESERVFHKRRSTLKTQSFLFELDLIDDRPPVPGDVDADSAASLSDSESVISYDSGASLSSSLAGIRRQRSPQLPKSCDLNSSRPRVMNKQMSCISTKSLAEPEVVTHWGVLVGKLMNQSMTPQDLSNIAGMLRRKTQMQTPTRYRILDSVRERASKVVQIAMMLAETTYKSRKDMLDGDWRITNNLLVKMFSTQSYDTLMLLATSARRIVAAQPTLVKVGAPSKVFGDIHGQLRDLLLLFRAFGAPQLESSDEQETPSNFVFNGDFVDRGAHQLEVVGLLLALKVLLPERVFLIRGNHEDKAMSEKYGFKAECMRQLGSDFGPKFFDAIHKTFDQLPLAAVIDRRVLVVHGGIGDGAWQLDDIQGLKRPITTDTLNNPNNRWIYNILWSDPIEEDEQDAGSVFGVHDSPRGESASTFGWNVTKTFCARNGLSLIIRSHQSKQDSLGFDIMHENLLIRIFTARDYEGHGNDGALLKIMPSSKGSVKNMLRVRPQVLRSVTKDQQDVAMAMASDQCTTLDAGIARRPPQQASQQMAPPTSPASSRSESSSSSSSKSSSSKSLSANSVELLSSLAPERRTAT